MESEDSSSQRRRAWEKLWEPGAFASSSYFSTLQKWQHDREGHHTRSNRGTGPGHYVSASSVDNLCTYSSIKRTNVTMIWTARLCTTFTVAVQSASDMNRVLAQIMYAFIHCFRCPQTIQRYRYDSTEARSTSRVLPTRCPRRYAFPLEGSC